MTSCPDELCWILWSFVEHYLVMQVSPSTSSRVTEKPDFIPISELLTLLDEDLVEVPVSGLEARPVVDLDHTPVSAIQSDVGHSPGRRRENG